MKYSYDVCTKAAKELERRRQNAQAVAAQHRSQVLAVCPELAVLEEQIRQSALSTVKLLNGSERDIKILKKLEKTNLQAQKDKANLLTELGFEPDYTDEKYTCPLCEDSGFINGRFCTCHTDLLKALACEELSKTSPSSQCGFDNFSLTYYSDKTDPLTGMKPRTVMKRTLRECRDYAENFAVGSPNLYFCGGTGVGKTHLSLAIAREVTEKGFGVVYITSQNLMNRLEREHFSKEATEDTHALVLDCDLLIIDDMGTEFSTSFTDAQLYNIVDTRLLTGKSVIINSNMTVEDIENKYDSRLASRINSYRYIDFTGADIRQLKIEQERK